MPRHIIHKQTIRLEVPSGQHVFAIQDKVRALLAGPLGVQLEAMLDEVGPADRLIRLERLHVNLGAIGAADFEEQFQQRLIGRLREALVLTEKAPGDENARVRSAAGMEAFLYFLSCGRLPWYSEIKDMAAWEEQLLRLPAAEWGTFPAWVGRQANRGLLISRLALQFTDEFLARVLGLAVAMPEDLLGIAQTLSASGQSTVREKIWTTALRLALTAEPAGPPDAAAIWEKVRSIAGLPGSLPGGAPGSPAEVPQGLSQGLSRGAPEGLPDGLLPGGPEGPQGSLPVSTPTSPQDVSPEGPPVRHGRRELAAGDEGSLWTSNSGIVILHPFLPALFGELGLVAGRRLVTEEAAQRAVLLLHYLATGETKAPEFGLVLQKIVCGLAPEAPVPARLEPTEFEKEECRSLLQAVTQHWPPLNRTSIEGLQGTFLQREGRLRPSENGWILRIEKKTLDILLDKLPWGLSLVRLPWMEAMITVEWTG